MVPGDKLAEDYLSAGQAATMLGVSAKTVSRWADMGLLPCIVTLGGHRRFDRGVIRDAAEQMGLGSRRHVEGA
jgi:excisionase family DNA binding protein